ncbi:unnamed protein product [Urochloa humidicola]
MYTTKPLSLFRSHPEAATELPPERNDGYLVVKSSSDEEDDETTCWGAIPTRRVLDLPFPQNRVLRVEYGGDDETVVFVPVTGQPLASNRYHIVIVTGRHRGLVRAGSREEDVTVLCCCRCVDDVDPRPFDPVDIYQQIVVVQHRPGMFTARAVAADGSPSWRYGCKYWDVYELQKIDISVVLGLCWDRSLTDTSNFLSGRESLPLSVSRCLSQALRLS